MRTLWQLCLLSPLPLLLVQCSAVTLPNPGETFSDLLSSGEPGPEMVVIPAGEFLMAASALPCGRTRSATAARNRFAG